MEQGETIPPYEVLKQKQRYNSGYDQQDEELVGHFSGLPRSSCIPPEHRYRPSCAQRCSTGHEITAVSQPAARFEPFKERRERYSSLIQLYLSCDQARREHRDESSTCKAQSNPQNSTILRSRGCAKTSTFPIFHKL